jgi:hypothetical protein
MTTYTLKPPFEINCFQCQKVILVKFCPPRQAYSNKNHWGWYTDKDENQGKYICDVCLINMYKHDKINYLNSITNSTKRRRLRDYIQGKIIHV